MPLGIYFCPSQDELNFGWSDGRRLEFTRWDENHHHLEDCVFLEMNGFWKTADCETSQPGAICYYPGSMGILNIDFLNQQLASSRIGGSGFVKSGFRIVRKLH